MTTTAKDLLAPLTASKLPNVYAKGTPRFRAISCTGALVSYPVDLGDADAVWFDENTTALNATMTIDDETGPAIPVGPLRGFRDIPCKRVYLTCAAQSGKVLNLWWGKGVYFYGAQPVGKGQWHDRNPVMVANGYTGLNQSPHGDTQRWTYTVPTGKKFMLEAIDIEIRRASAAGAANVLRSYCNYTPSGGGLSTLLDGFTRTNTVGEGSSKFGGFGAIMLAGDALAAYTGDASTGGTCDLHTGMKGTEFDA